MKILAGIVTHNRVKLLERCIDAIQKQSLQPQEILVINNGSTDGTEKMLTKKNITSIKQENLGSAGGWNAAIQYALDNNFDFIWLMDDDGFPSSESLKTLTTIIDNRFSCLSSVVVKEDDASSFVFSYPLIRENGNPETFKFWKKFYKVQDLPLLEESFYPYAHLFNGALINVNCIKKIGNVNIDYFMYGDEVDYYFRLRKVGLVGSTIFSKHYHPDILKREYSLPRIYYNIKNNIINYYKHYNLPLIRSILGPFVVLLRISKTNGILAVMNLLIGVNSKIFYKAILNGFRLRVGKDYIK
jgi:rhamnopyranosyl-N-acetylglucosaminyl-diphospho-decaprenol beta-1,3/1,4-galactofuranosyltransferase